MLKTVFIKTEVAFLHISNTHTHIYTYWLTDWLTHSLKHSLISSPTNVFISIRWSLLVVPNLIMWMLPISEPPSVHNIRPDHFMGNYHCSNLAPGGTPIVKKMSISNGVRLQDTEDAGESNGALVSKEMSFWLLRLASSLQARLVWRYYCVQVETFLAICVT